jgi:hypothetical protein
MRPQQSDHVASVLVTPQSDTAIGDADVEAAAVRRTTPSLTDATLAVLVRLILDDGWDQDSGARRLVEHCRGDLRVLRGARARVLRNTVEPVVGVNQRALRTLSAAIDLAASPWSPSPSSDRWVRAAPSDGASGSSRKGRQDLGR